MKNTKNRSVRLVVGFVGFIVLAVVGFSTFFPTNAFREEPENLAANDADLKFQTVKSDLAEPHLIDFHLPTNSLLISSDQPAKLELFSADSQNSFIANEIPQAQSIASVRDENLNFSIGEVFLGFEKGEIWRISGDSSKITKIRLPKENSIVGLAVDSTNSFGGNLIAVSDTGKIWQINKFNKPSLLLNLNTSFKGLTIIPNDFERYGFLAGKLLIGAFEQNGIYAIDAKGQTAFFPLSIKTQDIDLIAPNENLFAVSTDTGKVLEFGSDNFSNQNGDFLITSAESNGFYILHWDGTNFQTSPLKFNEKINQTTFAPITLIKNAGSCVTSISQFENIFQWDEGEGSFDVVAPSNCNWTATSNAPWLKIKSGQNGTGNGTVSYFVGKNPMPVLREANITVDTFTHRIRQSRKATLQCTLRFNPPNQTIGAIGGNGTINVTGNSECAWQAVSNQPWLTMTGNVFGAGNGSVSFSVATNFTAQTRIGYINFVDGGVEITQSPNLPPTISAGNDQTISLPNTASLSGSVSDDGIGNPITVSWSKINGDSSVLFSAANNLKTTAIFNKEGTYVLRLTATDGYLTATNDVQITVNPDPTPPPPDPTTTAPILTKTVVTNIAKSTEFLYSGANPIQTGVNPADIKAERVGLIRGKVVNKSGQPISNVKISVLDHAEFGQTKSRADGMFDLVVNGGGDLTVKYEKQGFITSQREEKIDWQQFCPLEDTVMIPYDGNVSFIDLNSPAPIQIAESGVITDADGSRQNRLFFKQGTTATITLPNNSTQNLTELHVRSTEFTVGNNGAETMPGDLPPTSAYTYASEYSVDEAVALDAKNITFSQPVVQYNENFLGFPVGIDVPSGSFDKTTGNWIPSTNGRVVKILSISNNAANLDLDGSGNPADDTAYNALGINLAEREQLAVTYTVNQTLWRVPVIHFSSWDSNWGYGPPPDSEPPDDNPPQCDSCDDEPDECDGCFLDIQNQSLGEEISITGTQFFLRYDSARQRGRASNRSLIIPLSGTTVPASLKNIKLTVTVLGRMFEQTFPPQANQSTAFMWDGMDAYGRAVQGSQAATVKIAYVYDGVYQQTYSFGSPGTGVEITGDRTRSEIEFVRTYTAFVSNQDMSQTGGFGGWSLNVHHIYDPNQKVLFQGDGKRRSVQSIRDVLKISAGNGNFGFDGDGGQASQATLANPTGVAIAPDGAYFIADSLNNRIRKVAPNGIITTVAGDGTECVPTTPCGDGGQATLAQLFNPTDVALAPDGSLYISDTESNRIRKVATDGIITTIVGTGFECVPTDSCGDGSTATLAVLNKPQHINLASDGTLFIADGESRRARRVSTDGIISTVAGSGVADCTSDDVPARNACLGSVKGVAQAPDGSLYISDDNGETDRIYRVGTNGIIKIVSNAIICNNALNEKPQIGDLGPLRVCDPNGLAVGADNNLYVASSFLGNIFKIDQAGNRSILAGTTEQGLEGDGQPALQSHLQAPKGIALAPNGNILVAEQSGQQIRQLQPILPRFTNNDFIIPSADGDELFLFNTDGRHLKTINALTNADKYVFGYDTNGRLITVTDGDGNITTIQRNGSGNPTGILSPYNQTTSLSLDTNGYLSAITNPANESNQFTYTSDGLMLTKKDALNNQNTFSYNAFGLLLRDDDAGSGFQTLMRTSQLNGYTVKYQTSLNLTSFFKVENQPNGDVVNTKTAADGTQTIETEGANGVVKITDADGTITETTLGADPRWAMQSPIEVSKTINVPNVGTYNSIFSSTVTLANPFDPLSLVSKTDSLTVNGKTTTSVFTTNNRTFVQTSPLNRQTTTVVDSQNRPTQFQFADLNAVNLIYDPRGRLSVTSTGSGAELRNSTFDYNPQGFISAVTNPLNQTNSFLHDLAGRTTSQTLADNRQINFGYDANGNLISLTPPSRPAHTFTYNAVNLVSSYTAPNVGGNNTTTYSYNLDKQITRITSPDSLQTDFSYDVSGRLQTISMPNGNYTYVYDATTGLPETFTAPDGNILTYEYSGFLPLRQTWTGTVAGNVSQTFNNDLLIASQSINDANTIDFSYDTDNLLIGAGSLSLSRNNQNGLLSGTTLGNITDTFVYSNFGEPVNYNAKFNTTTLYDVGYARDKLGRITQKTETIGGITTLYTYSYDLTGRLTTVTLNNAPQPLVTYSYDNSDNRTSVNVGGNITNASYDNQDRLTNYGAITYVYTANGELQSKTNGADVTVYNYDVVGNLRNVTLPNGTNIEYLIDAQNRRIGKKVNGTLMQGFLYQNQFKPVAELDANNNIVSRFVYASRSNTPDFMIKNGTIYRIITDQIGSVRLVVDTSTGIIIQRIDYDEFGVVLFDTNPNFQPFGFAGGLYDSNTGLTRFGSRDYDAEAGRWTAKDPILFAGGQFNLYSYVGNDPINFFDETGFNKLIDLLKPSADPNSYNEAFELTQYPTIYKEGVKELNKKIKELNDKIAEQTDLRNQLKICVYKKDKEKEAERKRKIKEKLNEVEARILELGDEIANLKNNLNSLAERYNTLRKFYFGNNSLPAVLNPVR